MNSGAPSRGNIGQHGQQQAQVSQVGPVLTVLASWAILSEEISLYQVVGLAVVLFAVSRLKPRGKQETKVPEAKGTAA